MAAYGAAVSLLQALSKLQHISSFQTFANAVLDLKRFLKENREVNRYFEFQIREAIYEAQDIMGSLKVSTQFLSPSEVELRIQRCEDLWMVAHRIESIAEMTTEEFHAETLDHQIPNWVWKSHDEIKSTEIKLPIVGRGEDFNQLKGRLMSGSEVLEVIPIVGIAGIGKTELAHWLLDDPLIRAHFDATGLVRISVKYDKRKTLFDLLGSLKERADGACISRLGKLRYKWTDALHQKTNDQLVKHLQRSLKYKRYLILLDDIREVAIWHDLKELFPDYYNRSRILITARNFDVAPASCHELDFLCYEDTLVQLVRMLFGEEPVPSDLAVIAVDIARSCRGFPRAVVTVGKLLKFANPITEYWEMVSSSIDTCGSNHSNLMEPLLLLTYNHLPQKLKVILLYMAIFPYTYTVRIMELKRLLVAEGLIEKTSTLFYSFIELMKRDFFHKHLKFNSVLFTRYGIAEEVFHEFLVRKAEEEKFFLVITKDTSYPSTQNNKASNEQRRLCVQQSIYPFIKDLSEYNSFSYIHSLLYCGPRNQYPLREWPKYFKLLEVFDALKVSFYTFPPEILKSVQLRYLALSYNRQLPATVCNLGDLQILIVSKYLNFKCSGVPSYLPADIWNLKDLWHLQVMGSDLPDPPSDSVVLLGNLYQLSDVSAHSCAQNILERLTNLCVLGVRIESSSEDEPLSFFSHLDILNDLSMFKCVVVYPDIGSQVSSSILAFPATLRHITLSGCGFPWDCISAIALLPELQTFKLKTYAFQGPEWEVKTNEFTQLDLLVLEDMNFENWTLASSTYSSFPMLETLIISHCYKLRDIPSAFADSSTLKQLEVVDCSTSAMNSALGIKEKILLNQGKDSIRFYIYSSMDDD